MTAAELIKYTIPFLNPSDSVEYAIEIMKDLKYNQLVYSDGVDYLGMFSLDILENISEKETLLVDVMPNFQKIFVKEHQHIFEILPIIQNNEIEVLAVMGEDMKYKGSILASDLILKYSQLLGSQELGAIIVLEIDNKDFSLAEVARLVESNDAKIVSSIYQTISNNQKHQNLLTIKLNVLDISRVVATLERYSYKIVNIFANEPLVSVEKERYDMLIKYLEI